MKSGTLYLTYVFLAAMMSALLCIPAGAQSEPVYVRAITDVSLNIRELALNVGDTYVLPLTHEPAETPASFLTWYYDDETIQVDPGTFTVTALRPGKTRLLAESTAGIAWDYCDITVSHTVPSPDAIEPLIFAGKDPALLSDSSLEKIRAESILRYLNFLENTDLTQEGLDKLTERRFRVTAIVEPGTSAAQSQKAAALGMSKAKDLPDFSAVSMYGTLSQILAFAKNNDSLIRLIEFSPMIIEDPEEEDVTAAKSLNLRDHVEELSSVSTAHDLGLLGDGTVIAVIDSGLNKNHEQFSGRVIAEFCASWIDDEDSDEISSTYSTCVKGSSEPSRAKNKTEFNHGSHVTGIAAGRDGIAPHAKIISINNSSETCSGDSCIKLLIMDILEVAQFLIDRQKEYKAEGKPLITAVNVSFGKNKKYDDPNTCDTDYPEFQQAFDLLLENGIIPVVSSGNNGINDGSSAYGCLSGTFSVGALVDDSTPSIRGSSNHGQTVDILAPGTKIWSALYAMDDSEGAVCDGINCYGSKSGTSMAAPMVTGAFALLKQANPNLTASQLKSQIVNMSEKSTNHRSASKSYQEHTFPYYKNILDFSEIEKYIFKPEPHHTSYFWPAEVEVLPRTGFPSARPQKLAAMPKDLNYKPLGLTLQIPSLDVAAEIVEVPVLDNEYAVTWLGESAGMLEGSDPSGKGMMILAAHNHLSNTETGPFALLKFLEKGDRIFISDSGNNLSIYEVYANEKAAETDIGAPARIAGPFETALVLITCEDETVSGGYASRRIAVARLRK